MWAGLGRTAVPAVTVTSPYLAGRRTACAPEAAARDGQAARATLVSPLLFTLSHNCSVLLRDMQTH